MMYVPSEVLPGSSDLSVSTQVCSEPVWTTVDSHPLEFDFILPGSDPRKDLMCRDPVEKEEGSGGRAVRRGASMSRRIPVRTVKGGGKTPSVVVSTGLSSSVGVMCTHVLG